MIANQEGTTVWRSDNTEPFGNSVPNGDPGNTGVAFDFPLRFPGQYFDRETSLAYNYFRDHDPGIGRYIQSDPIGLKGGINTYAYVVDSPLRFIDPKGLLAPPLCRGTDCVDPPYDPTPGGPKPSPQAPKDPKDPMDRPCPKVMEKLYGGCDCASISPSLGACLECCSTLAGVARSVDKGSCGETCYRKAGITMTCGARFL
jgi:RHS repeat-associated protein